MAFSNYRAEPVTATSVRLLWDWTGDNPSQFAITYFQTGTFADLNVITVDGSARQTVISGLTTGVEYNFSIGTGSVDTELTFTPALPRVFHGTTVASALPDVTSAASLTISTHIALTAEASLTGFSARILTPPNRVTVAEMLPSIEASATLTVERDISVVEVDEHLPEIEASASVRVFTLLSASRVAAALTAITGTATLTISTDIELRTIGAHLPVITAPQPLTLSRIRAPMIHSLEAEVDIPDVGFWAELDAGGPPYPGLRLEVDWDNDGRYRHAASDLSSYVVPNSFRCSRGRNYSAQVVARSPAGKLTAKLWSIDSRFDRFATESAISGIEAQGKTIRACIGNLEIWKGEIDDFTHREMQRGVGQINVTALGFLSKLQDETTSVSPRLNITTSAAANLVMDDSAVTDHDLNGNIVIGRWSVEDENILTTMREIEELELGFLCEKRDGDIWLQSRALREGGIYQNSAMALSDDVEIVKSRKIFEIKRIANSVIVPINSFTTGDAQDLWVAPGPISVPANAAIQVRMTYPTPDAPRNHIGAASWIAPVAGTDYTAINGLAVTTSTVGESLLVTFTNSTQSPIDIPAFKARGRPLVASPPFDLKRQDDASVAEFGERSYRQPNQRHTALASALSYADTLLNRHASLKPVYVIQWDISEKWRLAATLDLSRRITLCLGRETTDVFIEGITHEVKRGDYHLVTYFATRVPGASAPYAPLTPTISSDSYTAIDMRWNAPFSGGAAIDRYQPQYRELGAPSWTDLTYSGTSTRITGLVRGRTYQFRVRAHNSVGWSSWSGIANGQTFSGQPSLPRLSSTHYNRQRVEWDAPAGARGITGYDVQYRRTGTTAWTDHPHSGTGTSTTISSLRYDTSYDVRVRTNTTEGDSPWSGTASAKPLRVATITALSNSSIRSNGFYANWTLPTFSTGQGVDTIDIQTRQVGSSNWYTATGLASSDTSRLFRASTNTRREWRVRIVDNGNVGDWSATQSVQLAHSYFASGVEYTALAVVGSTLFACPASASRSIHAFTTAGVRSSSRDITVSPTRRRIRDIASDGTYLYVLIEEGQSSEYTVVRYNSSGGAATDVVRETTSSALRILAAARGRLYISASRPSSMAAYIPSSSEPAAARSSANDISVNVAGQNIVSVNSYSVSTLIVIRNTGAYYYSVNSETYAASAFNTENFDYMTRSGSTLYATSIPSGGTTRGIYRLYS